METPTRGPNVTDQAFVALRNAIMSGELEADSLHSVIEFANQLGVSRTPVREAVLRLADVGMVTIERNRGVRISSSNVEDVRWLFELRLLLEVPAAHAAAKRHDSTNIKNLKLDLAGMDHASETDDRHLMSVHHSSFHTNIDSSLENTRMNSVLEALRSASRARSSTVPRDRTYREITNEHCAIFEAIRDGDPAAAANAMRTHLLISGRLLMQRVASATGDPVHDNWEETFLYRVGASSE